MLQNTPDSLLLMLDLWTNEPDYVNRDAGKYRKKNDKDIAHLAKVAALGMHILAEASRDPIIEPDAVEELRSRLVSWSAPFWLL